MNNDLLDGVRNLRDVFDDLTPTFNEMLSSMKGVNKELGDLQSALGHVISMFKKFGQSFGQGSNFFVPAPIGGYRAKPWSHVEIGRNYAGRFYPESLNHGPRMNAGALWSAGINWSFRSQYKAWKKQLDQLKGDPAWGLDPTIDSLVSNHFKKRPSRFKGFLYRPLNTDDDLVGGMSGLKRWWREGRFGASWTDEDGKRFQSAPHGFKGIMTGAALVGAALVGLASVAVMAMKKMMSLSQGIFSAGVPILDVKDGWKHVRSFSGLAGALGMDPASLGQRARSFGDLLTGGGVPGGLAAMIGINPYGGLGGDQNFFGKFQKALSAITDPSMPFDRASIMSRQFGMEDLMYLRFASPNMRKKAFESSGMGSAEDMRKAADAQIQFNLTLKELTSTLMTLGQAVLPTLTLAMKNFGMVLSTTLAGGLIGLLLGGPVGGVIGMGVGAAGGLGLAAVFNNNTRATESQTAAMEKNTAALNTFMKEGVYGGGQRMRTAIPAAWGYSILEERALGLGRSLGAFSLG